MYKLLRVIIVASCWIGLVAITEAQPPIVKHREEKEGQVSPSDTGGTGNTYREDRGSKTALALWIQTIILGITAGIVYKYTKETQKLRGIASRQTTLIKRQIQLQTILQLIARWNSPEMIRTRSKAVERFRISMGGEEKSYEESFQALERVLEFFEDIGIASQEKILNKKLIWESTLGWYLTRYYFYSEDNGIIWAIRTLWAPAQPNEKVPVFANTQTLYEEQVAYEARRESVEKEDILDKLRKTMELFIKSETDYAKYTASVS